MKLPKMVKRSRSYNYTFTVHNQGIYDNTKKHDFYKHVNDKYPLSAYLIAQELYPNDTKTDLHPDKLGDSHLQGNLYFKSQVDFYPLLKHLQTMYKEVNNGSGLLNRVELLPIAKGTECRCDNYFKGKSKIGADPDVYTDMLGRLTALADVRFSQEFETIFLNVTRRLYGQDKVDTITKDLRSGKVKLI